VAPTRCRLVRICAAALMERSRKFPPDGLVQVVIGDRFLREPSQFAGRVPYPTATRTVPECDLDTWSRHHAGPSSCHARFVVAWWKRREVLLIRGLSLLFQFDSAMCTSSLDEHQRNNDVVNRRRGPVGHRDRCIRFAVLRFNLWPCASSSARHGGNPVPPVISPRRSAELFLPESRAPVGHAARGIRLSTSRISLERR
jgi:hypothetical protein